MKIHNNEKVSIIINCYNGERYLKECINSVRAQDYTNFELILWDNCSDDTSASIFKNYEDKRFMYYKSNEHTNLSKARNQSLKKTSSNYICFIDCDDSWESKKLSSQMMLINKYNYLLVHTNCNIIDENSKKISLYSSKKNYSNNTNALLKDYNIVFSSILFHKNFFLNQFNEDYHIIYDYDLILKQSTFHEFGYINQPLVNYRVHNKNESKVKREFFLKENINWVEDKENIKTFSKYSNFDNRKNEIYYAICKYLILNKSFREVYQFYYKIKFSIKKIKIFFLLTMQKNIKNK